MRLLHRLLALLASAGLVHAQSFVFVYADDLGWGDLRVQGSPYLETPNLDAMASAGLRLTRFYSHSWCPPARAQLLTGKHTGRVWYEAQAGLVLKPSGDPLLPEMLARAGYRTAIFGKWGLMNYASGPLGAPWLGQPQQLGWSDGLFFGTHTDAWMYFHDSPATAAQSTPFRPWVDPNTVRRNFWLIQGPSLSAQRTAPREYLHETVMQAALSFLDNIGSQPFLLYLPVQLPHAELVLPHDDPAWRPYERKAVAVDEPPSEDTYESPYVFPERYYDGSIAPYRRHVPFPRATYAALVTRLDADVGRLRRKLRERQLTRSTYLIVSSDNGPAASGTGLESHLPPRFDFRSAGPFKGRKGLLDEAGIRVPCVIEGPGIARGTVSQAPFWTPDLYATMADLAGQSYAHCDGISLAPLLRGAASIPVSSRTFYWDQWTTLPVPNWRHTHRVLMRDQWKLVHVTQSGRNLLELYDVVADPAERYDLAAAQPTLVQALRTAMIAAELPAPPGAMPEPKPSVP